MKQVSKIITASLLCALAFGSGATAATVLFPSQGGTGLSTGPTKGDLLVGSTTSAYARLGAGTNGKCLTASSTAPYGVSWEACATGGSGISSLNGLTGATQTFATSSAGSGFDFTSTSTVHTLRIGTAAAANTGLLTSSDWATFNGKLSAAVTSLTASAPLTGGTITGTGTIGLPKASSTADGYLSSSDWSTFNSKISSAVTSITVSAPLTGGTITTTGTIAIPKASSTADGYLSQTDWATFNGKQAALTLPLSIANGGTAATTSVLALNALLPSQTSNGGKYLTTDGTNASWATSTSTKTAYFVIENPTTTEDDAFFIFPTTSTISKVSAVNKSLGDTVTFNLFYDASRATATSSAKKVFSSYQAITATTTPTVLTSFSSSTPSTGNVLRLSTNGASSTQFLVTVDFYN